MDFIYLRGSYLIEYVVDFGDNYYRRSEVEYNVYVNLDSWVAISSNEEKAPSFIIDKLTYDFESDLFDTDIDNTIADTYFSVIKGVEDYYDNN